VEQGDAAADGDDQRGGDEQRACPRRGGRERLGRGRCRRNLVVVEGAVLLVQLAADPRDAAAVLVAQRRPVVGLLGTLARLHR